MSSINASAVISDPLDRNSTKTIDASFDFRSSISKGPQEQQQYTSVTRNKSSTEDDASKLKVKSIGNYILGKTLGEGTFGKVKLATHILTGEKVAIKVLEKNRIIDVTDVERVAREIYILKYIRHPNMVQLYEIIETPDQLFLVTEFISGGELFDYIVANSRVEEIEASKFFHQIIAGVEYISKLKIVHRDLKPENLLLDYNKNIKIVDFGLSNIYSENELLKTACGSPCYAAPEMIGGKKYSGIQVDIWSCGVILFAIVCGYLPFEDQNTAVLYKKILSGDYTIPNFVSEDGKDLITRILTVDPEKRITVDEIRNHPWMNQVEPPKISEGVIIGFHQTPIDYNIMSQLDQYGFDIDNAQKCLDANKRNHVTTTYYLLLKKFHQSGGQSTADINSETFDRTLLLPKPHQVKTNNYLGPIDQGQYEQESEIETDRESTLDLDINRSSDLTNMLNEASFRKNKALEIKQLYNSILDSSRDRLPTAHTSKGSRIQKDHSLIDTTNDLKRRSVASRKITFSPARNNMREERVFRSGIEAKEIASAQLNSEPQKPQRFFNKSFNDKVFNERIREIHKGGRDRSSRSKVSRGESYDGSTAGYQSFNQELLNGSFKSELRDTINQSLMSAIQPKIHGPMTKQTVKKQAYLHIIPSPKREKKVTPQLDEKANITTVSQIEKKFNPYLRGLSLTNHNSDKTRMSSQSPSRMTPMLPREPSYLKPRDSSMNAHRSKLHSRKNSGKPILQIGEAKPRRPSTNQQQDRDRGRSIGRVGESTRSQNINDGSINVGNTSFMLNSSFQKHVADISFDSTGHQGRAYINGLHKRMSIGAGQSRNRPAKMANLIGSADIYKKIEKKLSDKDVQ